MIAGLAALLCVRLAALYWNATDLFFDEAQYWAWSEQPAFGYFSKPPLVAWLIRVATEACGPGEACVRLPSPFLHTRPRSPSSSSGAGSMTPASARSQRSRSRRCPASRCRRD